MYTYVKCVKYIKIFNIFEKMLHRRLMISYLLVTGTLLKLYWMRKRLKSGPSTILLQDIFRSDNVYNKHYIRRKSSKKIFKYIDYLNIFFI